MKPIEEKLYEALYNILEIVCVDCKSDYKVNGVCTGCPRVVAARKALAEASGRRCPMARYTAKEMREQAEYEERVDGSLGTIEMLRQAADEMEREEKRKKDYEYSVIAKKHDGEVFLDTEHFSTLEGAVKNAEDSFYDVLRYERREVGKWEEVK